MSNRTGAEDELLRLTKSFKGAEQSIVRRPSEVEFCLNSIDCPEVCGFQGALTAQCPADTPAGSSRATGGHSFSRRVEIQITTVSRSRAKLIKSYQKVC